MPVSGGLYQAYAPRVQSIDDVQNALMQRDAFAQQAQLGQMNMLQKQQELQQANALQQAVRASGGDPTKLREAIVGSGNYAALDKHDQGQASIAKDQATAEKERVGTENARADNMSKKLELASRRFAGLDPNNDEAIVGAYDSAVKDGLFGADKQKAADAAVADINNLPPKGTPERLQWYARQLSQGLTMQQQAEQADKARSATETARRNAATEGQSAAQLAEMTRSHRVSEGIAGGHLALDQKRTSDALATPKGVYDSERGLIVNPRTGETTPVTADGAPIGAKAPKLREIPAAANKSIIENQQNLSRVDTALAALAKNPSAVGPSNMIPGMSTVKQYTDPEGVNARAGVADLGSMVIHDRSGAAVSVSEFPRLAPFIPSVSDTADTAKKKLENFRRVYAQEADLLGQTYSENQGYRSSAVLNKSKPAAPGNSPTKTVVRTGMHNGKKVIQYSDGSVDYAN